MACSSTVLSCVMLGVRTGGGQFLSCTRRLLPVMGDTPRLSSSHNHIADEAGKSSHKEAWNLPNPVEIESSEFSVPPLPPYVPREGEPLDIKVSRLYYQSRKRGMLENGLLLR